MKLLKIFGILFMANSLYAMDNRDDEKKELLSPNPNWPTTEIIFEKITIGNKELGNDNYLKLKDSYHVVTTDKYDDVKISYVKSRVFANSFNEKKIICMWRHTEKNSLFENKNNENGVVNRRSGGLTLFGEDPSNCHGILAVRLDLPSVWEKYELVPVNFTIRKYGYYSN